MGKKPPHIYIYTWRLTSPVKQSSIPIHSPESMLQLDFRAYHCAELFSVRSSLLPNLKGTFQFFLLLTSLVNTSPCKYLPPLSPFFSPLTPSLYLLSLLLLFHFSHSWVPSLSSLLSMVSTSNSGFSRQS